MTSPLRLAPGVFFGTEVGRWSWSDIQLQERAYTAGDFAPRHIHPRPTVCVILDGACEERHALGAWEGQPGVVAFRSAGAEHDDRWRSRGRSLGIEISAAWSEQLGQRLPEGVQLIPLITAAPFFSRLKQELAAADDLTPLGIEACLSQLCIDLARAPRSRDNGPRWLADARAYIHEHFTTAMQLGVLARTVRQPPGHVARTFRRVVGMSVGEYVRRVRVEYACTELRKRSRRAGEIGHTAGFFDQSHFTRVFKRFTGMTPSAYRRLHGVTPVPDAAGRTSVAR